MILMILMVEEVDEDEDDDDDDDDDDELKDDYEWITLYWSPCSAAGEL